jgi:streptogramin lyase
MTPTGYATPDSRPRRLSRLLRTALRSLTWPLLAAVPAAGAQTITEYPVPTPDCIPFDITAGPDGNLWFTEYGARAIARITPDGVITEFPLGPTPANVPFGIATGSDGNLWFTLSPEESGVAAIGRITPDGIVTQFPLAEGSDPSTIAAGPDGALWFVMAALNRIGRITTSGQVSSFAVPTPASGLTGIASGPDGNLWFTELDANQIGRMTPAGVVTEFPIPTPSSQPAEITAGPDGNVWFTELQANQIGRITAAGVVTEFPIPTPESSPEGNEIAAGPDGNLWFTESRANKIGRITTSGVITEFVVPTSASGPSAITAGPDGNVWFTEETGNNVGRITTGPAGPCVPDDHTLCLRNDRFSVTAAYQTSPSGPVFPATGVELTGDSGYFWFFGADNVELVVKVLDACVEPYQAYWFFAGGMTNVGVQISVTDRHTGESKSYGSPVGTPFPPILDTSAFATCP